MSAPQQTPPARPEPGTRVQFRWRKWDGSPHWVHDCVYLGHDRWGDWFGQRAGWRSTRPERDYLVDGPNVTLMPPSGQYALTVNLAPPATYRIYIDLGWDLRWDERDGQLEPTGIDMDLDVVSAVDGRGIWIDDRDEWDEHRVAYGYPLDIVEKLETLAVDLEERVRAGVAPFDDATPDAWLDRLDALEPAEPGVDA
jgi:protein associated with RNAse G/E